MGWLFSARWATRKDMLAHLVSYERWGEDFRIIRSSPRGNNHWYVAEKISTGQRFLGLDLMRGGTKNDPGWGYKDIDESMGPTETNCPVYLFNLVPDPGGHATAWRAKVLERAQREAHRRSYRQGTLVQLGYTLYRLEKPAGPRKGWVVRELIQTAKGLEDARLMRMPARQLAEATEIQP